MLTVVGLHVNVYISLHFQTSLLVKTYSLDI